MSKAPVPAMLRQGLLPRRSVPRWKSNACNWTHGRGDVPALRDPAGQGSRLANPARQELLVKLVVLADVEVAHFLVTGLAGGEDAVTCRGRKPL